MGEIMKQIRGTSVNWEVFRAVKDQYLTALTALNTFRHLFCFTDEERC
jgi:hypothetical protein